MIGGLAGPHGLRAGCSRRGPSGRRCRRDPDPAGRTESSSPRAGSLSANRPGSGSSKTPLLDQVPEHAVERVGIRARRRGQLIDPAEPGVEMVGDPQSRHHVQAPRCAKVAQGPEIHLIAMGQLSASTPDSLVPRSKSDNGDHFQVAWRDASSPAKCRVGPASAQTHPNDFATKNWCDPPPTDATWSTVTLEPFLSFVSMPYILPDRGLRKRTERMSRVPAPAGQTGHKAAR